LRVTALPAESGLEQQKAEAAKLEVARSRSLSQQT